MLLFVYGDDSFRVQEKVQQLRVAFKEKWDATGLNTSEFPAKDSAKLDIGEVLNAARALPFLGQKRMVVIRGLIDATKKVEAAAWVDGLKSAPSSTVVVFWETVSEPEITKKPLFVELKDGAEVHHYPFPMLNGVALARWVDDRVKARGGSIDPQATRVLADRVGADLWQMDGEVAKLVAYASEISITAAMVDELVRESFESKIFDFIDAISQGRKADAIRFLQTERWAGTDDHYLLTMLGRQVRILLGARALLDENPRATKADLASALALHPFVAQKALAQARRFSLGTLKRVHDSLFEFDQQIKTGALSIDTAVDLTAVRLMA